MWSPTTFTRIATGCWIQAEAQALLSDEHFTVDRTLLEAWASHKSLQRKGDPPPADPAGGRRQSDDRFKGERRGNATHQSTTDPDARLYKKARGREARLGYLGHVVMENRTGLIVDALVTPTTGTAERDASLVMISRRPGDHPITVGEDKACDTRDHAAELRHLRAMPHVAQFAPGSVAAVRSMPHDLPSWVCDQSAQTQTGRTGVWLDENDRAAPQTAPSPRRPRRVDLHLDGRGVQLGPDARVDPPGERVNRWRASWARTIPLIGRRPAAQRDELTEA